MYVQQEIVISKQSQEAETSGKSTKMDSHNNNAFLEAEVKVNVEGCLLNDILQYCKQGYLEAHSETSSELFFNSDKFLDENSSTNSANETYHNDQQCSDPQYPVCKNRPQPVLNSYCDNSHGETSSRHQNWLPPSSDTNSLLTSLDSAPPISLSSRNSFLLADESSLNIPSPCQTRNSSSSSLSGVYELPSSCSTPRVVSSNNDASSTVFEETNTTPSDTLAYLIRNDPEVRTIHKWFTDKRKNSSAGELSDSHRQIIVNRIIRHELAKSDERKICRDTFVRLAKSIVKYFPGEEESVYYVPSVNIRSDSKVAQTRSELGAKSTELASKRKSYTVQAAGRLYYAYTNTKKRSPVFSKGNCKKICKADPAPQNISAVTDSNVHDALLWLSTPNLSAWDEIQHYWDQTFSARQALFADTSFTILEYFKRFPCVALNNGQNLLISDFNRLYPGKLEKVDEKWKEALPTLLKFVKPDNFKDANLKAVALSLEGLKDEHDMIVPVLYLVASLLTPSFVSRPDVEGKVKRKRPTAEEVRQSFFLHVINASDVRQAIDARGDVLLKIGAHLQPLIIFAGPLTNIESSYVAIDNTLYHCSSSLDAVKLTFISFFTLNAKYPEEALQVWLWIQYLFFEINIPGDKKGSSLKTFLGRFPQK